MAAPGYPNMPPGHMPPMGGPPMGGPPMGGPPMGGPPQMMQPRPMKRGTSKAVPVVVSAGLAVGVFCGLLFGVGTGKASANPPTASNAQRLSTDENGEPKADPGAAPKGLGATSAKPVDTKPPATGSATAVAAAGSAAGSAAPTPTAPAGADAGSAKPAAVEEKKTIKVKLSVKPEGVKDAKILIDGKEIEGLVAELPGDTKSFKVEVKANGYHSYENKFSTIPDTAEMNVEFELKKRPTGGSPATGTGTIRPPKRPDRPTNAGGGGLIDI